MLGAILNSLPRWLKKWIRKGVNRIPDRLFIRLSYFCVFGKLPDLKHPKSYTEKIQWFKLNQTDKIFSDLADKYTVRAYVKAKIKDDILIPLYRHGTDPEAIPFETLPESFVIKCNHGSGYGIIIKDKATCNPSAIQKKLRNRLDEDYWLKWRELQYKNIKKEIVIEKLLIDETWNIPVDYKWYCFNGKPLYIGVVSWRFTNKSINYFNIERNKQPYSCVFPIWTHHISKPTCFEKMKQYARILSSWFPFVRVDFYQVNDKVYFGEMTFTPDSGYGKFKPNRKKVDRHFGDLIHLPH